MDLDAFWSLIDRSRSGHERDPDGQADALTALLTGMHSEELVAFHRLYREQLGRAYRWDVWGAGYVLNRGMSNDAFDDFCSWLIGRGRDAFERVLADPDALADVPGAEPDEIEAESLAGAVYEAHEQTHGSELPDADRVGRDLLSKPAGEEWDEFDADALAERYPRLTAKGGR